MVPLQILTRVTQPLVKFEAERTEVAGPFLEGWKTEGATCICGTCISNTSLFALLVPLYLIPSGSQKVRMEQEDCTHQSSFFFLILSWSGLLSHLEGWNSWFRLPVQCSQWCDVWSMHLVDAYLALWFLQWAFVWKQLAQLNNFSHSE